MKTMLTIGDSFTYGEELADLSNAWPHVLSKSIGYKLTNLAQPSKGNSYMLRTCIENSKSYDLVIIAWSVFSRLEFSDQYGTYDIWPGSNAVKFSHPDVKHRTDLIKYISYHHSDRYMYDQYLVYVLSAQHYLKNLNIPYVFLDAFQNNQYRNLGNTELMSQVDETYFLGWPNETMMEWTYNLACGPHGHFLELGHQRVSEKINEHIRNLGWVS